MIQPSAQSAQELSPIGCREISDTKGEFVKPSTKRYTYGTAKQNKETTQTVTPYNPWLRRLQEPGMRITKIGYGDVFKVGSARLVNVTHNTTHSGASSVHLQTPRDANGSIGRSIQSRR